jgi:hypothetical protein
MIAAVSAGRPMRMKSSSQSLDQWG